jgi:hypothetical protein
VLVDVVAVASGAKANGKYDPGRIRASCGRKPAWMMMSMAVTLAAAWVSALLDA